MKCSVVRSGVAMLAIVPLVVTLGCSSGSKVHLPAGEMYDREQLEEFDRIVGQPIGITPEYRIGVGDRLDVVLLYHSNLTTREILVRDDGRISLPYVGDQVAMGYTPMELDSVLTDKFGEILREPNLSVMVREPAQKKVYVMGFVQAGGEREYTRQISLLQAISMSGGFRRGAKPENVVVIRRSTPDEIVGIEINAKAILEEGSIGNDIQLRNYDIVYVPQSRLDSAADLAETLGQIVNLPFRTVLEGWQMAIQVETLRFLRDQDRENN